MLRVNFRTNHRIKLYFVKLCLWSTIVVLIATTSWRNLLSGALLFVDGNHNIASQWFRSIIRLPLTTRTCNQDDNDSLLTIDPSKILPTMIRHGGLFLPKYIENELNVLAQVCHVEESKLDVVNRKLELVNVTVSMDKNHHPAMRIGRVRFEWDSYLQPCVEIYVEQVEVLVEFTNLLLTRTNWNELNDVGFPPRLLLESADDGDDSSSSYSTFVRIGSLGFKGSVVVRIQSRPLQHKPLTQDLHLDLSALQELSREIKALSKNEDTRTRPGCTTTELYGLTTEWLQTKIQIVLQKIVLGMATTLPDDAGRSALGQELQRHAQQFASSARNVLSEYASNAGDKLLQDQLNQYRDLVPKQHLDRVKNLSRKYFLDKVADGSIFKNGVISRIFQDNNIEPIGVDKDSHEFPEDIMFPDW